MTYRIESKNELGEWENGIGDGEVYEYDTVDELMEDVAYIGIDDFETSGTYRIVES